MRIHHDSVTNRQKPPFEGGHGTVSSGKGARSAGEDDQRDRLSMGGGAEPRVPTGGMSALRSRR